ncbi:MAG: cell division protein FtsQ/DivIB [Balneolaceae bacterium]
MPWVTALMLISGIAVVAALYWNQNMTVQKVKVNALHYTDEAQIQQTASNTIGLNPDSVDLSLLVNQIEKFVYVKSVTPFIEPNGSLTLDITEREPLALLIDGSSRIYVDEDGVRLPVLTGKSKDVPLLYGYSSAATADTLKDESFLQVRDFLLKAKENGFGWATISEIAFDEIEGVVALSHENGVKLLFGRNDFETKLENWEAFYAEVIRTKGIQVMQQVDLRFSNQVVTRES